MKNKKIFTTLLLLFSFIGFTQDDPSKKEQIKALKTAFITTELDLTSAEAEKFWPIYNAFEEKQFELRHEKIRSYQNRLEKDLTTISEKEAAQLLAKIEATEDELHQLRKKFNADIKGVLSAVKIIKLRKAEDNFNRKLLKQYRGSGGPQKGRN
jgi:Spy/CpxP family protein refolding chaperone